MKFVYKAIDKEGKVVEGELELPDKAEAISYIEAQGFTPLVIEKKKQFALSLSLPLFKQRVSPKDVIIFTQSLASLINAGVSLDKALKISKDVLQDSPLSAIIENIIEDIKGGNSLAGALAKHRHVFSDLYISMIKAGEAGGVLGTVLESLASYLLRSYEFKGNLISSLIYPVLLFVVSILSLVVLIIFVVPRFMLMFKTMDINPPLPIIITSSIGIFFRRYWWSLILLVGGISYYLNARLKRPDGKLWRDEKLLNLPLIGKLLLKIENARFARTLGILLGNGVPILQALMITKEIVGNEVLKREVELVYVGIREGEKLANLLSRHKKHWHTALLSLISIGEETGRLAEMLNKCAGILERDVEETLRKIVSLAEPMTIIVMGVLVGTLVISMLVAIFSINTTVF